METKPPVRSGMRVLVVRLEANSGPATARNAGMCVARRLGVQLVCFLDADCLPEVRVALVLTSRPRRRAAALRDSSPDPACVWARCTGPSRRTGVQVTRAVSFPCWHMRLAAASKLLSSPRLMSMKASHPPWRALITPSFPLGRAACSCGHLLASMPGGGVKTLGFL